MNKRFAEPINFRDYFAGKASQPTKKSILKNLYNYSSVIAHGAQKDWKRKELGILKNQNTVIEFLDVLTRKLFVHALIEPQLILDLRNC